jgi:CDP-diacylglycerol--glycerol-3-phosphate 3-phosphatidyltransferase
LRPTHNRLITITPNTLSLIRLALAAIFPAIAPGWRLPVVVIAALTDWLDGYVARRWHVSSATGQLLDALADKLFVLSVLVTMALTDLLAWWQLPVIIARDLSVAVVMLYVAMRRQWESLRRMVPRSPGKVTTALQFLLFATLLLLGQHPVCTVIFIVTGACSLLAAGDYLREFVKALREDA